MNKNKISIFFLSGFQYFNMYKKRNFAALALLFFSSQIQAQDDNYVPTPVKPVESLLGPKTAGIPGKGILGFQVLLGASYDNIKPGIQAVKDKDTSDVTIGPGGGTGIDIYAGKQLNKIFRFGLNAGFMIARGAPPLKDATVRYTRFYVTPVLNAGIKLNAESYINIGLGGYASFGNSLFIKAPAGQPITKFEITYKPNIGVVSHIQYENLVGENFSVFIGLRFHWVNLEVNEVTAGGVKRSLNPILAAIFNNKNGGGVALQFGMNYFF